MRSIRAGRTARASLAAGLAAVVTLGTTIAVAPGAAAAPVPVAYSCTSPDGPVTMDFAFEAEAPDPPGTITLFRSPTPITMRMESGVPDALADAAAGRGADSVTVSVTTSFSDAYPVSQASWRTTTFVTAAPVALGDSSGSTPRPFVGRGLHSLMQPGVNELRPTDLRVSLVFADTDDPDNAARVDLTCTAPSTPVVDTVWVKSVSFLDLLVGSDDWDEAWTTRTYSYGQPIPVRVRVSVLGTRPAAGWVDVTLDEVTRRVPLDGDGLAAVLMPGPRDRADRHQVTAAFVPADPTVQGGGATVHPPGLTNYPNPVPVAVASAETSPRVRVTGKRADRVARARVRVDADFDSDPTGKVTVTLRRLGTSKAWTRTRSLDDTRAKVRLGRLPAGRYKLVVGYRGDGNHLGSKAVERFRVRR